VLTNRKEQKQFPLVGALGLSVAVHVVLLLLTFLLPLVASTAAPDELDEPTEITFTFVDGPETEEDRPAEDFPPDGVDPVPIPVPPELPPIDIPADSVEDPFDAPVDPALEEFVEEPPDLPVEDPVDPVDDPTEAEAEPDPAAPIDPAPPDEEGSPTDAEPEATAAARPRLNMSQALRDYGKQLSQQPPPPPPPSGDSQDNVIIPDLSQVPSTGFGMGNMVFESGDYDWSEYGRQVYMAIWRAWHHRLWATADDFEKWAHTTQEWVLNHQSAVGFTIQRNGEVTAIVHEGSSGCGPLDASALDALAEVILPPLPADFPRSTETVHARFVAVGEVQAMRPQLNRLKRAGLF